MGRVCDGGGFWQLGTHRQHSCRIGELAAKEPFLSRTPTSLPHILPPMDGRRVWGAEAGDNDSFGASSALHI